MLLLLPPPLGIRRMAQRQSLHATLMVHLRRRTSWWKGRQRLVVLATTRADGPMSRVLVQRAAEPHAIQLASKVIITVVGQLTRSETWQCGHI